MADIRIEDHGSIMMVRPISEAGEAWVNENLTNPETQFWGGAAACERRYVEDIVYGVQCDGLEVEGLEADAE